MYKHISLRAFAALTALSIVLACGGGGDIAGNQFPLTASITLVAVNNDVQNVHLLINGEAFDPAVNRVTPGATVTRMSPQTFTWDNAATTIGFTIFAGRNGATFAQGSISLTGDQRMSGMRIRAVFNADQTVTVTRE